MGGLAAAILIRGVPGRGGLAVNHLAVILVVIVVASSYGCGCRGRRCHDEERRALLELKESSTASYFREEDQEDCCRWSGIACGNHTGRVVGIDLSLRRVTEEDTWYPNFTSLVRFRELERLSILVENRIGSTSLNVLCNLKYLKELSLIIWSSWEGPIPQCVCNMRSLTSLYLYGGDSLNSDGIPSCLENLHNLESLQLMGIKNIDTTFLDTLCNLKYLKELSLDIWSSSQGPIPQCFCNMSSLTSLYLSADGRNNDGTPLCLGNLHSLESLRLMDIKIIGSTFLDSLRNLRRLKELDFSGNSLLLDV